MNLLRDLLGKRYGSKSPGRDPSEAQYAASINLVGRGYQRNHRSDVKNKRLEEAFRQKCLHIESVGADFLVWQDLLPLLNDKFEIVLQRGGSNRLPELGHLLLGGRQIGGRRRIDPQIQVPRSAGPISEAKLQSKRSL